VRATPQGLLPELCEATAALKWKAPTPIQAASIPDALKGSDIIGLAETGAPRLSFWPLA